MKTVNDLINAVNAGTITAEQAADIASKNYRFAAAVRNFSPSTPEQFAGYRPILAAMTTRQTAAAAAPRPAVEMVRCSCGHSVPAVQVMRASLGSACPDCYDRMSD